ncbi:MAG: PKD domain-containing protein [Flavobacteriales bacterium]
MKKVFMQKAAMLLATVCLSVAATAQFNYMYQHNTDDDHTSMISTISRTGYVQAGSQLVAGNWDVHLMRLDASGNLMNDVTFSTTNQEHALHIVQGNNNTYIICGYEKVGALDLGFVMSVDTNFNFINKVRINVPANNKHTPALHVMNSAFYLQPNNNLYFPGDPNGGYVITGFEAVGYNANDSKSGYAIKMDNNLVIQWARKFDSPISAGQPDWDMCNSASWIWSGSLGYFIGGSGTAPSLEQCGMAARVSLSGGSIWKELYTDNSGAGTNCVAADCAYDDAEFELYHLTNFSGTQSGGITAFNEFTGVINNARTRYLVAGYSNDHYTYEFGATCAGNEILIAGYGHNQTNNSITGTFPFIMRYDKNNPLVNPWGAHYELTVPSVNYNPNTTIYDIYQGSNQPRVYYPKIYAQRNTNEIVLSAFEDNTTFDENKVIQTDFIGKDSCGYFDPLFAPLPHNSFLFPVNMVAATYTLSPNSPAQNALTATPIPCLNCPVNTNFTYTVSSCTYTFTASAANLCAGWTIYDSSNNVIFTTTGISFSYTFTLNGTYTVCYADCAIGSNGMICRDETCQTVTVNCVSPCGVMNADFSFVVSGCCVTFTDLTPDGNPFGCESWTFGTITSVLAGDNYTFCFPGSGTYNVCHNDCCYNSSNGTYTYHQICKTVTVNCTPPCCLPTGFVVSASSLCCRTFSPFFNTGCTPSPNLQYWWNFGDGNTSTAANPTHCYAGSGIYTVCVTFWCSKLNQFTYCQTIIVKCILPPPPPCCIGTSKINLNTSGQMVQASNGMEIGPDLIITSQLWEWGDGTTSNTASAEHYYGYSGSFTVTCTADGTRGGIPFTSVATQTITVHMAPPCICPPDDPFVFADSPLQCNAGSHSTCLKVIDWDGEAGTIYQWMESSTAGGPYTEIPGAIGQQVWINNMNGPKYYVCRCMSALTGGYTISDEVSVTDHHFSASSTATSNTICAGSPVTIVVTPADAVYYEWLPQQSYTASATVSPATTTTYEIFVRDASGCGAETMQTITVNPCPACDNPGNAAQIPNSGGAYPQGNCYNNTLDFADVSPQGNPANVLPGGGQDVWYQFTAQSSTVYFTGSTTTFDMVLELHTAAFVQVDMENSVAGIGGENMLSTGLTTGATYYLAIRSYDGSTGPFSICMQSLMQSYCNDGNGTYDLCTNFKAKWTGASSYIYNFTPVAPTPGVPTSVTGAGSVALSHATLALQHGGCYDVRIDAVYNIGGNVVVVQGATICSICIAPHASVEVKLAQRCPATLLKSSVLQGKPFVCGALYYTIEFTPVTNCAGTTTTGLSFTKQTTGASATLNLSFTSPQALQNNTHYRVRFRPTFGYGDGVYGNPQVIFIGGSNMDEAQLTPQDENEKHDDVPSLLLYPNPCNGEMLQVNLTNFGEAAMQLLVLDNTGKIVFAQQLIISDVSQTTALHFARRLASGVYHLVISSDGEHYTERFVVMRD